MTDGQFLRSLAMQLELSNRIVGDEHTLKRLIDLAEKLDVGMPQFDGHAEVSWLREEWLRLNVEVHELYALIDKMRSGATTH